MGREKDQQEKTEAAWDHKAQAENFRCSTCSLKIPYADREVFFNTKMCAYCAHQEEKDD